MTLNTLSIRRSGGFTLMELLVVISIVLILAGMSFAVSTKVLENAKKAKARNAANQLVQSIATYYTEYRKYPIDSSTGGTSDATVESNSTLMDVLLGVEGNALNPREIVFFSGNKAKGGNRPKGGIEGSGNGGGELFDPFDKGTGYFWVVMDTNFNGKVADPAQGGAENIPKGVISWSSGIDGIDDQGLGDDITTW